MNVSYECAKSILDTLPISFYIRQPDINVDLEENGTSTYIDLSSLKINVGFQLIKAAAENVKDDKSIEKIVRGLLYHEVSHAYLTPFTLKQMSSWELDSILNQLRDSGTIKMSNNEVHEFKEFLRNNVSISSFINLFEDERIETILRDYYLGVDFKWLVYSVNKEAIDKPDDYKSDFMEFAFKAIRCRRYGYNERVSKIILSFSEMMSNTDPSTCNEYKKALVNLAIDLYLDYISHQDANEDENEESSNQNSGDGNDGSSEESSSDEKCNDDLKTNMSQQSSGSSSKNEDGTDESSSESNESEDEGFKEFMNELDDLTDGERKEIKDKLISNDKIKDCFDKVSSQIGEDEWIRNNLEVILQSSKKLEKRNAGAISSYSGVFSPRSVARDDYKYFLQRNDNGSNKSYQKIKINLFVDVSGSFYRDMPQINKMILSLKRLKRASSNFDFSVIACGMGEKVIDVMNTNKLLVASGCNNLDDKIFSVFQSVQSKECFNYNIVVFDGDAFSGIYKRREDAKHFSAFDQNNTLVISDTENEGDITRYCKKARKIFIRGNYASTFIRETVSAMKELIR